jgi:hypothetical protein
VLERLNVGEREVKLEIRNWKREKRGDFIRQNARDGEECARANAEEKVGLLRLK